jgi:hypothetical protein
VTRLDATDRRRRFRRALRVTVLVWVAVAIPLGALLLARHMVALPSPDREDPVLAAAVAAHAPPGSWFAVHFLYRECACSRRVVDHLLARSRPAGLRERVVLVGTGAPPVPDRLADDLAARGFAIEIATPRELGSRWHIEAAPLLVVADPAGRVRYSGGYGRRKQDPNVEDLTILAELEGASDPATLPVFGCAVSERLDRAIDPLGLGRVR